MPYLWLVNHPPPYSSNKIHSAHPPPPPHLLIRRNCRLTDDFTVARLWIYVQLTVLNTSNFTSALVYNFYLTKGTASQDFRAIVFFIIWLPYSQTNRLEKFSKLAIRKSALSDMRLECFLASVNTIFVHSAQLWLGAVPDSAKLNYWVFCQYTILWKMPLTFVLTFFLWMILTFFRVDSLYD